MKMRDGRDGGVMSRFGNVSALYTLERVGREPFSALIIGKTPTQMKEPGEGRAGKEREMNN